MLVKRLDDILYRPVQGINWLELPNQPRPFLPMPAHDRSLVAGFAQSHHSVVITLFDVVRVTRPGNTTDTAGLILY